MGSTIYDTDYSKLTPEQKQALSTYHGPNSGSLVLPTKPSSIADISKEARHYDSLFPGHYLDPVDLRAKEKEFTEVTKMFKVLIDNKATNEQDVQAFISDNKAWFLVGSLVRRGYYFGHHELYLFPEFQLTVDYRADYLLVGSGSGGFEFLFVELESVYGKITIEDGEFGKPIRSGLNQVKRWKKWNESSFASLKNVFAKAVREVGMDLPNAFSEYASSKVHYMVIAGRRDNYNAITRSLKDQELVHNIRIAHYDNMVENALDTIGLPTY